MTIASASEEDVLRDGGGAVVCALPSAPPTSIRSPTLEGVTLYSATTRSNLHITQNYYVVSVSALGVGPTIASAMKRVGCGGRAGGQPTELVFELPRPEGPAHLPLVHAHLPHGEGPRVLRPPAALLAVYEVVALPEVGKP